MDVFVKVRTAFFGFVSHEDGAVSVDFVVLTSAIVGLGIAVIAAVSVGTGTLGDTVSQTVASMETDMSSPEASDEPPADGPDAEGDGDSVPNR